MRRILFMNLSRGFTIKKLSLPAKQFGLNLGLMFNEEIYISAGSNAGNRESMLKEAIGKLADVAGSVKTLSGIYETAPWGNMEQPLFLNQVLRLSSRLDPRDLMSTLLLIEQALGRERTGTRWNSRTIDLDILFVGSLILDTPALHLPHPQISNRRFILIPMAEIAPSFVHPVLNRTIAELLQECPDTLSVWKWDSHPGALGK
jgi:2-amino-4-hydroxy-6-hydroxymethyldihydropteridine diphosphokinase